MSTPGTLSVPATPEQEGRHRRYLATQTHARRSLMLALGCGGLLLVLDPAPYPWEGACALWGLLSALILASATVADVVLVSRAALLAARDPHPDATGAIDIAGWGRAPEVRPAPPTQRRQALWPGEAPGATPVSAAGVPRS